MRRWEGIHKYTERKRWEKYEDEYLGEDQEPQFYLEQEKYDDTATESALFAILKSTLLTEIQQGVDDTERIGRKIIITRISCQGKINIEAETNAVNTNQTVVVRVLVDKQTNLTGFISTDLLEADTYNSFLNLANEQRFEVLWEKQYDLYITGATPTDGPILISNDPPVVVNYNVDRVWGSCQRKVDIDIECYIPILYLNTEDNDGGLDEHTSNAIWLTVQASRDATGQIHLENRVLFIDA